MDKDSNEATVEAIFRRLSAGEPPPLLPSAPRDRGVIAAIEEIEPALVANGDHGRCLCAALYLLGDDLEASHRLSQQGSHPVAMYLHGVMHRREGDFDNACYWFRRSPDHAMHATLLEFARTAAIEYPRQPFSRWVMQATAWDPRRFVRLVQADPNPEVLRAVQRRELELLVEHCR